MKQDFVVVLGAVAATKTFGHLADRTLKSVVFGALDDVALAGSTNLSVEFDRLIEGGPATFTKIRPGQSKSAVYERRARVVDGRVQSSVGVRRIQSTYLKYLMGEASVRLPGDTGVAKKFNFIPQTGARSAGGFSLATDAQGNLAKNALKKLNKAARPQGEKDAASAKRKLGRDATAEELAAIRQKRAAARRAKAEAAKKVDYTSGRGIRDEKGLYISKERWGSFSQAKRDQLAKRAGAGRAGAVGRAAIFWGRVGRGGAMGFYERVGDGKPKLLVLGVKKSTYRNPYLAGAWNESMERAGQSASSFWRVFERLSLTMACRGHWLAS